MRETLGNLKIVAVWFEGGKLNVKSEWTPCGDFLLAWTYLEGMLYEFASSFIQNLKKCPVNTNWEVELILKRHCFCLAQSTTVCKSEV